MMTSQQALTAPHPPTTLADALLPARGGGLSQAILRGALLVVAGAALTAVAAQLRFTMPWSPVPYTGQTAAVLLVGVGLGWRLGALSMLLYLAVGLMGAPVFTGGGHGIEHLLGATGGYLIGFVAAAALVGRLAERGWDRTPGRVVALMLLGNAVIYLLGVTVLAAVLEMPAGEALWRGAAVFLPWDAFKVVVAAGLLPGAWWLVGRRRG
jgi:biotin transport system substrate-specific component